MAALHPGLAPALGELSELMGPRLDTSEAARAEHGRDESPLRPALPDAVAVVTSTEEVAAVLRICNAHGVPVVPFGAGTSLEGHVLATSGGISIDLKGMDEIVAVRVDDLDATVQAGVTRKTLNERLRRDGLFFPVDPGADATLGGMAATGASGTTTVRYGAMRTNVLALEVVLADGRIITTAGRARKSSAGYDLTRLFLGSEGTLGVITQVTVRTYGLPVAMAGATAAFEDVDAAVQTAIATLQVGIPVARIEFLDAASIGAINAHAGTAYPERPTLFLEFHGSEAEVVEQAASVEAIAAGFGVTAFDSAIEPERRKQLWRARHEHFYATLALRAGARAITTDVCVPISRLAECISATRADLERGSVQATIAGHVGDGNFHVLLLVDPDDPAEMSEAEDFNQRLVERALAMDGTCTGEHGIGLRKIASLATERPGAVEVMALLKSALDPNGILNPGKVLPDG